MRVVGVDPGLKGAIACVDMETGSAEVTDMPVFEYVDGRLMPCAYGVAEILKSMRPSIIVLEHVEARRGSGATSEWRFAQGFGATLAACQLTGIRHKVHLVRPRLWKDKMGLSSDKNQSLAAARESFPELYSQLKRAKDDGRAEALLLTQYYRQHVIPAGEVEVI